MSVDTKVKLYIKLTNNIEYVKAHEVSEQVDFARSGNFNESRIDNNVVDMYP